MTRGIERPSPEQLLKQVEAEGRYQSRGKLKIFLGYASGVGKSFRMLDEGRRRKERGEDVVVAAVQPSLPLEVEDLLRGFEVIPVRTDLGVPVVDVPAIQRRRPGVCLIDGLAYDNPPQAKNAHRWQDVEELLHAGISVSTTVNLQYVKEHQKQVEAIRGKVVRESVPEAFIRTADEIEIVDAPPEYCVTISLQRDGRTIDAGELARQLSELREIALLLAAEVVDRQLEDYLRRRGIEQHYGTHERILVCVTPRSNASLMIQRGRRQADRFHGELHVVYVEQDELSPDDRRTLARNLLYAREARAHVQVVHGDDPVGAILRFAGQHGITQIFVGHSQRTGWLDRLRPNPVERLILDAEGIDVRVFPQEEPGRE
ncbi:MAG: universal stress protein [Bryobacteraceae bacterium]